jgi:DNA-binding MarR family transcriptional regulator
MRDEEVLDRLFQLASVMGDAMAEDLAARNLSRARATVLALLHRIGRSNQRTLADALGVTPRNVTGLVDGLEAAGLVQRAPDPNDRRALVVSLTAAGQRAADAMAEDHREFARFLFANHRRADLDRLTQDLDQLLTRLDDPDFTELRRSSLARWPRS